jgi:alkylation response protein AidB-like acyl-CoA dehydrogenase
VDNRVGDENGGWAIARTSIGHERSTAFIAADIRYRRIVRELVELAQENGTSKDPLVRQQLAQLEIEVRLLGFNGMRSLSTVLKGGEPGPESSISRLFHGQFERRLHEVAVDITGAYGLLDRRDPHSVQRGRWVWGMLRTRASTIGAGTAEIQRNTIGERVLGLPHEPGLTPQ